MITASCDRCGATVSTLDTDRAILTGALSPWHGDADDDGYGQIAAAVALPAGWQRAAASNGLDEVLLCDGCAS